MRFPWNIYVPAFMGALLASMSSLPAWRALSRRTGLVDDPGHRKIHHTPIPLAGGFAILTGLAVPLLVGFVALHWSFPLPDFGRRIVSYGLRPDNRSLEIGAIVLGALGMLLLGWFDDRYELPPRAKFAGQFLIALGVALANVRITLFIHNALFNYGVTVLWILTVANAFNFMDNMNGLCAGLGAIGAASFALLAGLTGQYLVAVMGLLACGALIGYLPYNFPRASVFLGDTGSHLVGYLLAVMAILPHFYTVHRPHAYAVLAPLVVLAVPLGDLAWVVMLRWRLGKPFYVGDNNHLSHRLVRSGLSQRNAVLVIWALGAVSGALGLLLVL